MHKSLLTSRLALSFILIIVTVGMMSCGDDCHEDGLITFFTGQVDNQELKGDGVSFSMQDSIYQIRLLAGDASFYKGVAISIPYDRDRTYDIAANEASIYDVYGLDAIGGVLNSNDNPLNKIDLTWDHEAGLVEGSFEFECIDDNATSVSKVSGAFRVQIGLIAEEWECGFVKFEPDSDCCRFIRG